MVGALGDKPPSELKRNFGAAHRREVGEILKIGFVTCQFCQWP